MELQIVFSVIYVVAIPQVVGESMKVVPHLLKASFGDGVEFDCVTSERNLISYIQKRVSWTFTNGQGETATLTSGFDPTAEARAKFDSGKYNIGFNTVNNSSGKAFISSLNITAAHRSDAGSYKCLLKTANGTEISNGEGILSLKARPIPCEDDPNHVCDYLHQTTNICSDINLAKLKCRKSCNLCNLVDGSWDDWASWSVCHVTCGPGIRTRTRVCDSPAPANRGSDCTGNSTEVTSCSLQQCSVDGGWSDWQTWSGCSVTCGPGLQYRARTCSRPTPSNSGRYCVGDNKDYTTCSLASCQAGVGWSTWQTWSSCNGTTCGPLTHTRTVNTED